MQLNLFTKKRGTMGPLRVQISLWVHLQPGHTVRYETEDCRWRVASCCPACCPCKPRRVAPARWPGAVGPKRAKRGRGNALQSAAMSTYHGVLWAGVHLRLVELTPHHAHVHGVHLHLALAMVDHIEDLGGRASYYAYYAVRRRAESPDLPTRCKPDPFPNSGAQLHTPSVAGTRMARARY